MCGICGIIHDDPLKSVDRRVLETMNHTMIHRGPDDEGYFFGRGSGLAMRRLSIIDVEGGHQPFVSEDGNVLAICNGEIYNYRALRRELRDQGHLFRTQSDAEVLPHLYEEYGSDMLKKLNGMFGLAVWDEKNRELRIARDRMGEKPLYWSYKNGQFIFGSELKSILVHPDITSNINRKALSKYLAYEYVPAPLTIIDNVNKLEPGHILIFKNGNISVRPYWDLPSGHETGGVREIEASRQILDHLDRSVKMRLVSDVPLGVFLSGGVDSSTVVALMARHMEPADIKTFSIAFEEKSFDESSYARTVAEHFKTDHHEERVSASDLIHLIPQVSSFLDEPFADASIIPTFALSQFTKKHVTVALGGDGGDELFAGYPTFQAEKLAQIYRYVPNFLKKGFFEVIASCLPVSDKNISFDFKVKQFLKGAQVSDLTRHIIWLGSFSPDEQKKLLSFDPPKDIFSEVSKHSWNSQSSSAGNRLLYLYAKTYLADDILVKVDRAGMAASLETRAPFLDHELVEYVAKLPFEMKMRGFTLKDILKKTVAPLLPKNIPNRKKKGFGIPVAQWIKGPLKGIVTDLLSSDRVKSEGFFDPKEVTKILDDHFKGRRDNRKKIWTLFMFENWLERWGN